MFRRIITNFVECSATESLKSNSTQLRVNYFTDPNLSSLEWLHNEAPCFPINSQNIQVIASPDIFYEKLLEKSGSAMKRITIASLYIGTGKLEKAFISNIEANKCLGDGKLKINILLDYSRGSRGNVNSRTILLPLLQKHKEVVHLSLYHTPALRGIYKKILPPRWNELVGLQHMKLYIFDDSLIISGANLSNDYFTNRQDRYFCIDDQPLADFYHELVSCVQEFSLNVDSSNNVHLAKNWSLLPYTGKKEKFVGESGRKIKSLLARTYEMQKNKSSSCTKDTWVFPLVEMGQLNIHNDSIVTQKFFSSAIPKSTICLATGYFNLTQEYMKTLTDNCLATCKVLMAHPNANGFQGARGPAGGIPAAYCLLAQKFQASLRHNCRRIHLFEYLRPGWTYHAKGLWYYLPSCHYPVLTFIGSPNFGARSVKRDLETQIIIITTSDVLKHTLNEESENLFARSLVADTSRSIPYWVHTAVYLFRNYF